MPKYTLLTYRKCAQRRCRKRGWSSTVSSALGECLIGSCFERAAWKAASVRVTLTPRQRPPAAASTAAAESPPPSTSTLNADDGGVDVQPTSYPKLGAGSVQGRELDDEAAVACRGSAAHAALPNQNVPAAAEALPQPSRPFKKFQAGGGWLSTSSQT